MKNFIIITLVYFVTTLSNADTLEYANADEYSVTIESVKLCQNATINSEESFSVSGCVTLGNSSLTVDITAADINGTHGKYADTNIKVLFFSNGKIIKAPIYYINVK